MFPVFLFALLLIDTAVTAALLMRYKSANEAFKVMTESYSQLVKAVCASDALKSGKQVSLSDVVAMMAVKDTDDE